MATEAEKIWRDVHAGLRAFIAKRVSDPAQADDILQEVFLRVHRRIGSLRDPRRVVSWVYQITRHAIIDSYRKSGKAREIPAGLGTDLELSGPVSASVLSDRAEDSPALRTELAGCLRPMIERLSQDYGDAIMLVEIEGLTQQAAAKQMGLSLSGMKSRVQRGRKQLKQMLDDCCLIELDRRGGVLDVLPRQVTCDSCTERE